MGTRAKSTWLQRLRGLFDSTIRLSVEDQGIRLRHGRKSRSIRWDEVVEIAIQAIDKVCYDESFLILVRQDRSTFSLGELDIGFREAVTAVEERFPDLPRDWEAYLAASNGPVAWRVIWRRKDEPAEAFTAP